MRAALFFLMTFFLAALSIIAKAELNILKASFLSVLETFSIFFIISFIARLRLLLEACLRREPRIAFLADCVIGIPYEIGRVRLRYICPFG